MEIEETPGNETQLKAFSYIPTVDTFSEDLIEALDPENGIEEEYMPYHNPVKLTEYIDV